MSGCFSMLQRLWWLMPGACTAVPPAAVQGSRRIRAGENGPEKEMDDGLLLIGA